ncbi:uncharacterized protein G2W53_034980 [Senna tora]|uniref:Uncharacterized protein n=1 Tax=Senna tora TaxID=362788 RepID=A0A834W3J0_9FABA|nr:uncharacterized protein G2W53_034980 [Senna tora]
MATNSNKDQRKRTCLIALSFSPSPLRKKKPVCTLLHGAGVITVFHSAVITLVSHSHGAEFALSLEQKQALVKKPVFALSLE